MKETQQRARYLRLDEIRGLTLVSMALYHFLWDLVFIAGIDIPWYRSRAGHIWQQSICWTFILLSGFCWSLGRRQLKRGLTVFFAGGLVTLVTLVFLPEDRIVFGVLTLLGSSMLLLLPLDRLFSRIKKHSLLLCCLALSFFCFCLFRDVNEGYLLPFAVAGIRIPLPERLYSGWISTYLGFPMREFYSTDYFSLIPWFFLYLTGYFCQRLVLPSEDGMGNTAVPQRIRRFLRTGTIPYAHIPGRHSLLVYLLHQPVLYAVTLLIIHLRNR